MGAPDNSGFYQSAYANSFPQNYANTQSMNTNALGSMNSGFNSNVDMSGTMYSGELTKGLLAAFLTTGYPGEQPLLEELGINFAHIKTKTLAVLNPFNKSITSEIMSDSDLAGPILFVMLFGLLLLLAGKVQFGYIYGVGVFGSISLHYLFRLMSNDVQLDFLRSASVLGYCLLPLVILSIPGVFLPMDNLTGYISSAIAITWCTYSASGLFVVLLRLHNVRPLIAYPLGIFYTIFALMAIFVEKKSL